MTTDFDRYRLFASPRSGSAIAEALLARCGAAFALQDVAGYERTGPARSRLLAVNPLGQVPTLVLPAGEVLTESAAIALHLADRFPEAGQAPAPDDPVRPAFLNRLVWIVANVYPTFFYADEPGRWVDPAEAQAFAARVDGHRETLWRSLEDRIAASDWILGERFSALDVYVAVMANWRPGPAWFAKNCPRLQAISRRCFALDEIGRVLRRDFPGAHRDGEHT